MNVRNRLKEFIKYKDIPVRKFEDIIGVSHSYVSNIRVSIQPDKMKNIAKYFPELNTEWLLTGEGDMLRPTPQISGNILVGDGNKNVQLGHGSNTMQLLADAKDTISALEKKIIYLEGELKAKDKEIEGLQNMITLLIK